MQKAVFLDRDGTVIVDKHYLNHPSQIEYLEGAFTALKKIQAAGYKLFIVTNQSGVASGKVDSKNLDKIHQLMDDRLTQEGVYIEEFLSAPYLSTSNHYYRKPNPGMLKEIAIYYNIDLSQSWMVGDKMSDVESGHRAQTKSILLGNLEDPNDFKWSPPEACVVTLKQVAEVICSEL